MYYGHGCRLRSSTSRCWCGRVMLLLYFASTKAMTPDNNNNNTCDDDDQRKYESLEKWCHSLFSSGHWLDTDSNGRPLFNILVANEAKNIGYPTVSVLSFLRNIHVRNVKRSYHGIMGKGKLYMERFHKGKSLLDIAREFNHPPYFIVKIIIDQLLHDGLLLQQHKKIIHQIIEDPWTAERQQQQTHGDTNQLLLLTNNENSTGSSDLGGTTTIYTTDLYDQVSEAIRADPIDGPQHSRECNILGVEYEMRLQQRLRDMDIPFETEEELRSKGTSKTPDILLSIPLGIRAATSNSSSSTNQQGGWKMIFWIDSKALFGDVKTHELNVMRQAHQYVHRFGPGLILYWLGHAPCLLGDDDVTIAAWDLPKYFMLPTGDLIGRGFIRLAVTAITESDKDENVVHK